MKTKDLHIEAEKLEELLRSVDMMAIKMKHYQSCREIYIPYSQLLKYPRFFTPVEPKYEFMAPAFVAWNNCSNGEYLMHLAIVTVSTDKGIEVGKYGEYDEYYDHNFVWDVMTLFGALHLFEDFNVDHKKDKLKWQADYHNAMILYHIIKTKLIDFKWYDCQGGCTSYKMHLNYATKKYISAPMALANDRETYNDFYKIDKDYFKKGLPSDKIVL